MTTDLADVLSLTDRFETAVMPIVDRVPFDNTDRASSRWLFSGLAMSIGPRIAA